jgi:hypothetical protein
LGHFGRSDEHERRGANSAQISGRSGKGDPAAATGGPHGKFICVQDTPEGRIGAAMLAHDLESINVMSHGVTRTAAVLLLLAAFDLTPAAAAPVSATGSTALAVAAVIASYSPLLSANEKSTIAGLFNGNARAGKKLIVTADSIICRTGNVDITARSCEMIFDKGKRTLKGREANEVIATLAAAGATAEGAAGSMIQTVTKLSCTLDPDVIKDNSGGGADCSFATDR